MQKRIPCLTKFGKSGGGGNYTFCVSKSYTLRDVSRKKRWVEKTKTKKNNMNCTILPMEAPLSTGNASISELKMKSKMQIIHK